MIKLDFQKLLGFRLAAMAVSDAATGVDIGSMVGTKIGGMVGAKVIGSVTGSKIVAT